MKKAYLSPELKKVMIGLDDVLTGSKPTFNLGGGDWGVQDDFA